jgi:hypothetical protein
MDAVEAEALEGLAPGQKLIQVPPPDRLPARHRGLVGLQRRALLTADKTYKKAPPSAVGYTAEHRHTLADPFGPVGRMSGAAAPKVRSRLRPAKKPTTKRTASKRIARTRRD